MAKLKLKEKILLGMAAGLDTSIDFWENLNSPYNFHKRGEHYAKQTIYNTVSSLLKTGEIRKKVNKKGEAVYEITSQGQVKIRYSLPILKFNSKKWDGIWRLISFDVPQKNNRLRNKLREKLKQLGFGMLQESLWLTPHDIAGNLEEALGQENLRDYCVIWEAKTLFGENEKELAKRVWKLEDLHGKYLDFVEKWSEEKEKRKLENEYLDLLLTDPGLPKELLPDYWDFGFGRAKKIYQDLTKT